MQRRQALSRDEHSCHRGGGMLIEGDDGVDFAMTDLLVCGSALRALNQRVE
jgi:hypothetical protein